MGRYNCKRKKKHNWILIGTGYAACTIRCDIVCAECGKTCTVILIDNDVAKERIHNILKSEDHKFSIPRSIYLGKEELL